MSVPILAEGLPALLGKVLAFDVSYCALFSVYNIVVDVVVKCLSTNQAILGVAS